MKKWPFDPKNTLKTAKIGRCGHSKVPINLKFDRKTDFQLNHPVLDSKKGVKFEKMAI